MPLPKKQRIITTRQFHDRINETTQVFNNVAHASSAQFQAFKNIVQVLGTHGRLLEKESYDTCMEVAGICAQVIPVVTDKLLACREVVANPPTYYPHNTERLDQWELTIAVEYIQDILERIDPLVQATTLIGKDLEAVVSKPDAENEKVVETTATESVQSTEV